MAKKMLIDATHTEETRVVVADGNIVEEFDFETASKRQLAGNIYLAKVTRVEPSLQAAFVDYGGNRHGFLAFAEIHPDYYQIPAADREVLKAEERAEAEAAAKAEDSGPSRRSRSGTRGRRKADAADGDDDKTQNEAGNGAETASESTGTSAASRSEDIPGMAIMDGGDAGAGDDNAPVSLIGDEADDGDADIEDVGHDDGQEDIRPARRSRARRYKIQEVIKTRQIMLVQVVKEERGNKGAALTTYLSLAGRYCVLMPNTARGGGISRKITNAADRKKLKDIASTLEVPQGAGLIIRTAGSQRTRTEIRRDYEYLMRLWEQIRELTFKSIAPAQIYEEGDLIKRSIRDLYSREIDEVLVEGERGYRTAKGFMAMIMPSHARKVKHYVDPMPLFARHQVENYLGGMFNPVVQLKSGGYIVIGITEALVAIDVNSGRATKEGSIEETAYKTNCEAADEIARQLRLRDLAGLIVIDFIDMDERKHNASVEKRLKDKLKSDRARIQVGRISGFGLLEMSRQRLHPGMLESITRPCAHCHGTGLIRSDDSVGLTVLRAIEEEGTRKRSREVLVSAPVAVVNFLINSKREHIAAIEARFGMAVRLEADPAKIAPDYTIEKFKTASRSIAGTDGAGADKSAPVVSVDAELMASIDIAEDDPADEVAAEKPDQTPQATASEDQPRRRRRRRRRSSRGEAENGQATADNQGEASTASAGAGKGAEQPAKDAADAASAPMAKVADKPAEDAGDKPAEAAAPTTTRRRRSTSRTAAAKVEDQPEVEAKSADTDGGDAGEADAAPAKAEPEAEKPAPTRRRTRRSPARATAAADAAEEAAPKEDTARAAVAAEPAAPAPDKAGKTAEVESTASKPTSDAAEPTGKAAETAADPAADTAAKPNGTAEQKASPTKTEEPAPAMAEADDDPDRPKRTGWWNA